VGGQVVAELSELGVGCAGGRLGLAAGAFRQVLDLVVLLGGQDVVAVRRHRSEPQLQVSGGQGVIRRRAPQGEGGR